MRFTLYLDWAALLLILTMLLVNSCLLSAIEKAPITESFITESMGSLG